MNMQSPKFTQGEHRRHEDIGPVVLFEVKPKGSGQFVAVELDYHGQPVDVFDASSLDAMGWSKKRLTPNSLTEAEIILARNLKTAGKSAREIASELSISRATAQRITQGVEKGASSKITQRVLSEVDFRRIKRLRSRGWGIQTIANVLDVCHETVRQIVKREESKSNV